MTYTISGTVTDFQGGSNILPGIVVTATLDEFGNYTIDTSVESGDYVVQSVELTLIFNES